MPPHEELEFDRPQEGFRGVPWCTRAAAIPWQWSTDGFAVPCKQRADENLAVLGLQADELTYTFRNSLLYGVRIDFSGSEQVQSALASLQKTYAPSAEIEQRGGRVWCWQTAATRVWLEVPRGPEQRGKVFLWGRHPIFADDASSPIYLALPPRHNSFSGPFVPRSYVCYRTSGPIQIDGNLDEKAWRDAQWTDIFFRTTRHPMRHRRGKVPVPKCSTMMITSTSAPSCKKKMCRARW